MKIRLVIPPNPVLERLLGPPGRRVPSTLRTRDGRVSVRPPRASGDPRARRLRQQMTTFAVLLALFATAFVIVGEGGIVSVVQMRSRIARLQYEIGRVEQENRDVLERVHALQNDPAAIEKLAREELGMARSDETIYLLPPTLRPPDDVPLDLVPSSPTAPSLPRRR